MNKSQIEYKIGDVNHIFDILCGGMEIVNSVAAINFANKSIEGFSESNYTKGILNGALSLVSGLYAVGDFVGRFCRKRIYQKVTSKDEDKFPLQTVDKIEVEDKTGLEFLLTKTEFNTKKEWGAAIESCYENGTGVIKKIGTYEDNAECFGDQKNTDMTVNPKAIEKKGYNGFSHYHPFGKGMNYNINRIDKGACPAEGINLLTFNMPWGSEVIVYNQKYVYLSSNESKTEFVKANPKDILKYLGKPRKKKEKITFPTLVPNELRPYFA